MRKQGVSSILTVGGAAGRSAAAGSERRTPGPCTAGYPAPETFPATWERPGSASGRPRRVAGPGESSGPPWRERLRVVGRRHHVTITVHKATYWPGPRWPAAITAPVAQSRSSNACAISLASSASGRLGKLGGRSVHHGNPSPRPHQQGVEFAQLVKHRETPTRRDAGVGADAVIMLANILRRLAEPE